MFNQKLLRVHALLGSLALSSSLALPAAAVTTAQIFVNGVLQASYTCADPEFDCTDPSELGFFASISSPGDWDISISGAFHPLSGTNTPDIVYSSAVTDRGDADTFGFIFLQDIASVLGSVTHDNSSSTTDGGFDGVPVSVVAPPAGITLDGDGFPEINVYTLSTNGGTTYLSSGLDLRQAFAQPGGGGSDVQADLSEAGAGPGGAFDRMRVDVNFGLAGNDDSFTSGGTAAIVVPEPTTLGFLVIGLTALGFAGRKRS